MTQPPETQSQRPAPTRSTLSIFKDVYRANLLLMAVIILLGFSVSYITRGAKNPWNPTYVVTALYALVPFAAHSYVHSGGRYAGFRALTAASPIITVCYAIVMSVVFIGMLDNTARLIESIFFNNAPSSATTIVLIFAGAALFLVLCCSTLGMMLSALVDGFDLKTIAAIRVKALWGAFWRLTVLTVIFAVLTFLTITLHQELMGVLGLGVFDDHGIGVTLIQYATLTLLLFAFLTCLAVVLSKAYLGSYTTAAT